MHHVLDFASPDVLRVAIGTACFAIGAWLGTLFPDIDRFKIFRLRHRSIVTHSFLMPLLLWTGLSFTTAEWPEWFIPGFAAGVALHLAFDLFPQKWRGFALVDVPKWGRSTRTVSTVLLFSNLFLCVIISVSIFPEHGPAGILAYAATLTALYLYGLLAKKEHFAAGPLLTILTLGGDAL
ncbi:MAG: hypothetical protein F4X14_06960 [Caldilineaceae bacterium SB0661_bin_32]|uniref:Uncharacterized protein n=1 Tax=Caldilineaceae bacterium SB0661_bin_32 TaxID=2605255 RepID=A0A6B1D563_9CHLR|nr:hypothetical protein [Caldilineaceae bacterium SB0661_bin_32]